MAEKQVIIVVESTAALGPYWDTILVDYVDKIIRSLVGTDSTGQKPSVSNVEFALATFNTHGCYSSVLVQRTGWTRDPDIFFLWLSAIPFTGGGFNDAAIAEGLAEALMMFPSSQDGGPNPQNVDMHKHCILIAASNPYPLQTPVYVPRLPNIEQSETIDSDAGNRLYDAEAVAKAFSQLSVSLSVICPKQLAKIKAIYNAGKRNNRAADPPVDVKVSHFLVLISESFKEARAALSRSGVTSVPSNQSPVKVDAVSGIPVTGAPPTSMPSVNGSIPNRQPISGGNVVPATVKVEPVPVTTMVPGPGFPHNSSAPRATANNQGVPSLQTSSPSSMTQDIMTNNENAQDTKPTASMLQPMRPVNSAQANMNILNKVSQARQVMNSAALGSGTSMGIQSMGQTPVAMHMSNMISSGMASSIPAPQNVFSSGQSGITSISSSGPLNGPAQVAQNSGLSSIASATSNMAGSPNIGISQPMGNVQGAVSMGQQVPGMSQGNPSGAQMVQGGVNMNQNMINNGLGPSVVSSGTGTMIPTPGMSQQVQPGMQPLVNNNAAANMSLPQQTSGGMQSTQSKYVKVWEGSLSGQRQGQPVFITKLEGYRNASASQTLAANWPPVMQIVRLISQDHMNNKQYVGKADFLVFRAMNPHGFLGQLQEKKLCAVIQLPSQTLLLSVSDKAFRLIGMLFPGDMVVFKPQLTSQQQQQMQQQQQQHQQLQSGQHLPQLQQQQQLPHMQQQQLPQLQQQQPQQQQQQPPQQQQLPQLQQQQQLPQLQQQQQHQQLQQQQLPQQVQLQQQQQQQQQQLPQIQQQQHPQLQQQQLSQLQPQQQLPQLQQLQQHQQLPQQQLVGAGMGQAYVQGPGRSQLVSQGQVSSQGGTNMGGGGSFIN